MDDICRKSFTVIYLFDLLGQSVGMDVRYAAINMSIYDYKEGSFLWAEMITQQFNLCSKHCANKNI